MKSLEPIDTVADTFGHLYRIYSENNLYTVVTHNPDGHPFNIESKRWKTLRGARRWIERDMSSGEDLRRKLALGKVVLEPGFWDTMDSFGFEFVGPQHPNGRQPHPIPGYLPSDTGNVVTFRRPGQMVADADQQLDYVFAACGFHTSVSTRASNSVEQWGSSDHCRVMTEISATQ